MECETCIPVSESPVQNVWVETEAVAEATDGLRSHGAIESVEQLNGPEPPILFSLRWASLQDPLLEGLERVGATVLGLESDGNNWRCTIRCPSQDAASRFHQHCLEHDLRCTITSVSNATVAEERVRLTENQQEALQIALSTGYFSVPRETTLEELAGSLGISDTAASQRIRRGVRTMLRSQLGT